MKEITNEELHDAIDTLTASIQHLTYAMREELQNKDNERQPHQTLRVIE